MKNFLLWIIATLIVWWWIVIANDLVADWIYIVIHYWLWILLFWLIIYTMVKLHEIIIFNYSYDLNEPPIEAKIYSALAFFIPVLLLIFWLKYAFFNNWVMENERNFAKSIASHIHFEKWKIPIIEIWNLSNK